MNTKWVRNVSTVVLSASLLLSAAPLTVIAKGASVAATTVAAYQLTDTIKAETKSILNEKVADGTRIGAVVRLYNQGSRVARVPDYEVRAVTKDGVEYTLRPSAINPGTIQPKEKVELSYMIVVDRVDVFSLSELTWVEVDDFVYPRKETNRLSIPISSQEWQGLSGSTPVKKWGEPFTLPDVSSAQEYTIVNAVQQNTSQGPVTVVILQAENKGEVKETIPDIRIDGNADKKVYSGKRVEQDPIALEPGEKQEVHYSILTENKAKLKSLIVLTPESFVKADQTSIQYRIGRLNVPLPSEAGGSAAIDRIQPYEFEKPIRFDPLNKLINPELDVSMVEMHLHKAEGDGFKTVIVKFKLDNRSDSPVPVPNFLAQLVSADGRNYLGTRQNSAAQTLEPNLSYVMSYSFNVPDSETGDKLAVKIMDGQTAAPYRIPIAAFRTQIQKESEGERLALYPFSLKLNDLDVSASYSNFAYTYKLKLNLDIQRKDNIVVDQNFSKLKIELADQLGRTLGSETISFTGNNRLISGWQTISIGNLRTEQLEYPLIVNLYESIDTPFGEAKRLIKSVRK